ncbi:retropepsin-like aspartic protease family protein [Novosphingobium lentum]|uniref:retropepsin-like aspartic protease family protein n=1 Tax=Novosphingobium lentum TaxID=145287 RepID=UPI001FDF22E6|nr:TIGR02281 family clan AA aspartic protease [Novosphingobium lentum]
MTSLRTFISRLPAPPAWVASLPPLVLVALGAIVLGIVGGLLGRRLPSTGRFLRTLGNLGLIAVLAVACLRLVRLDPAFDALAPNLGLPAQTVVGTETRIPLSSDGHYWIEAEVDGSAQRFMVDTGATVTALSDDAARAAGIAPDPLRLPVIVRTANGTIQAQLGHIGTLRFGSVVARDLDAIVTGSTGGLNVLGMNFLSRLKGWRVEGGTLILEPRHPQPAS